MAFYITDKGCIPDNTPASVYRMSCENKNLLRKEGSLYVGTGETQSATGYNCVSTFTYAQGQSSVVVPFLSEENNMGHIFDKDGQKICEIPILNRQISLPNGPFTPGEVYYVCIAYATDLAVTGAVVPPETPGEYTLTCTINSDGSKKVTWGSSNETKAYEMLRTVVDNVVKGFEVVKKNASSSQDKETVANCITQLQNLFNDASIYQLGDVLYVNGDVSAAMSPTDPNTLVIDSQN